MVDFSPALQFVIECARRSCGARARPLPADPSWPEALRHAEAQSLYSAVAAVVATLPDSAPDSESRRQIMRRAVVARMQRHLRQEPGIQRVFSVLQEAGCAPVVLKGCALAYSSYVRPEFRSFADLDLLLSADQLERANRALLASGFQINAAVPLPHGHQHLAPLFAPNREIVVELHGTLFEARSSFDATIGDCMARAEPTTILGHAVRMLSPTDALIHTCAHLSYGHRYLRHPLRSLTDILALSQKGTVDWTVLVWRAREAKMNGAVIWPLAVARAWLGAPVPAWVIQQLMPSQPLRSLIGIAMGSGFILDRGAVADDGTAVAYERLLDLSLLGHSSAVELGRALLNGLFPPAAAVSRHSGEAPISPTRHALHLVRPKRVWRGLRAASRLVARREDWTRSEAFRD